MGNLFKSSTESTKQSSGDSISNKAFDSAYPLYQQNLNEGVNVLTDVMANPAYTGQRVAGLNPYQTNSANRFGSFADATGNNSYNLLNAGNANLNAGAGYGTNATNLYSQYAGADPTQSILSSANQYANNPYVDGIIDASGRDVTRQLNEQTLPSLNRQFSGTGNTNSTRAGVESAIAQRGTTDRLADMSNSIRGQFFGTGLNMAQNQYNQNLQNTLGINNQLLNAGNAGQNYLNAGQQYANNNFTAGQQAGGVYQTQNQNELNANKSLFDETMQNRLNALGTISSVANGGAKWNGGAQSTSGTTTENPSLISSVGKVAGLVGSFF